MMRDKVLEMASLACLKELYTKVQPSVDWDDFIKENKDYSEKYKQWEQMPDRPNIEEFCGPRPYEFYYLPSNVMKEITDSYVRAYNIDAQQNLLDIIDILKGYCDKPIKDAYIKEDGVERRSYIHPDNLEKEIRNTLKMYCDDSEADLSYVAEEIKSIFFNFLDMAGNFYSWNRDLNCFNTTVYLGPSPCSNKERVIENWKQYRDKDIIIDDSIYKEDEED